MRSIRSKARCTLAAAGVLLVCALPLAAFALVELEPDRYEPNDDFAEAGPIALNEYQPHHKIYFFDGEPFKGTTQDIDFAAFSLETPTTILLEAADGIGPATTVNDMVVSLFDSQMAAIDTGPYVFTTLEPGAYFASITSQSSFGVLDAVVPSYAYHVRDAALPDRYESDDVSSDATFITMDGAAQIHNFHTADDEDWVFFIVSAESGQFQTFIEPVGGSVEVDHEVYYLDGASLVRMETDRPEYEDIYLPNGAPRYYLRTRNAAKGEPNAVETHYRITVRHAFGSTGGLFLGTVAGIVLTTGGDAIDGARLSLDELRGVETVSEELGAYIFPGLPSGGYTLRAEHAGHESVTRPLTIANNAIVEQTFALTYTVPPVLEVEPASIMLTDSAGAGIASVRNGGADTLDWAASIVGGDWIRIASVAAGEGDGDIELEYDANEGGTPRTATLRVAATYGADEERADGSPVEIPIAQRAYPDLNNDGAVNAVDVQLIINAVLGIGASIDVNGDGEADAVDVQLVIIAVLTA